MDKETELEQKIKRLEREVKRLSQKLKRHKYGLVWLDIPEAFENDCENKLPVLKEIFPY